MLGILVGVGLSVGFGVPFDWPIKLAAGLGSFALGCFLIWWRPSRRTLMGFMHRLIGG